MEFKSKDFTDAKRVLKIRKLKVGLTGRPNAAPVLNEIDLDIRAGETHCLVGESGSGKSVTSLAAMGLLPKDALEIQGGLIDLEGFEITNAKPSQMRELRARRIAMIFQEPMTALNPVLRVGEQIEEVLNMHTDLSQAEAKTRTLDMMDQVHLPDVERIYQAFPHQLSGGQRQRIMIAMALILDPDLLIADEPTTALDVTTQLQILKLIAEMQERHGTAVLFITHDMGVVAEIADTVSVMQKGRIVERAPIRELLTAPQRRLYPQAAESGTKSQAPSRASGLREKGRDHGRRAGHDLWRRRFLPQIRRGESRARCEFHHQARANSGHRRRVRFGQIDRRALHHAADRPDGGQGHRGGHRDRAAQPPSAATAPQAPPDRVSGPLQVAQPALDRGAQPLRGADQFRHVERRGDGQGRRAHGAGGSARATRWTAIRTSSRAGSASASRSRGPSR